jgi:Domain of unknown function (DUF1835)
MLHILDGASSADTLSKTDVPGEIFAWREALISGPTPAGLNEDEWIAIRSEYLSQHYRVDSERCKSDLEEQSQTLASYPEHDEVVLWFEHDLFCQTNLLYLLNWFSHQQLGSTKLSLICIGEFAGIDDFRGLGQLNEQQLASLFDTRHEVSTAELALGQKGWQAYSSSDPTRIEELLRTDFDALPFLRRALELHVTRFPSVRNGLNSVENSGLQLIADGATRFDELFPRFMNNQPGYGLGDFQFWLELRGLSEARKPLLQVTNGAAAAADVSSAEMRKTRFDLTAEGERVMLNEADFVEINGLDRWLGGVHLSAANIWRWDETKRVLVQ